MSYLRAKEQTERRRQNIQLSIERIKSIRNISVVLRTKCNYFQLCKCEVHSLRKKFHSIQNLREKVFEI
jgi:hypothetical protein